MADDHEARPGPRESTITGSTPQPAAPPGHRRAPRMRPSGDGMTAARKRAAGIVATAVSVATTAVVFVLAVHIVFVLFDANTANTLVSTAADWAHRLAWEFRDVFRPEDPKMGVAVNYGLAGLVYLILGRIAVGLIRRLG